MGKVKSESPEIASSKGKRRKQDAADQVLADKETSIDRGTAKRKLKKVKKGDQAVAEHVESEEVSRKAKKRKKEAKTSGEADVHPSWDAAKTKEKRGALVKGAGARTTFNSDSEE